MLARRISVFEQRARVRREDVFIASSLPRQGRGMEGRGPGVVTVVRVIIWVRPWDTPRMARKVNTPGNISGRGREG